MTRHDQGTEASPDPWQQLKDAIVRLIGAENHKRDAKAAVDRARAAVEAAHRAEVEAGRNEVEHWVTRYNELEQWRVQQSVTIARLTQERDKWFRLYCILSDRMKEETQSLREAEAERDALAAQIAGLREALAPFAIYARARAAKPISGLDDVIHGIHTGTAWAAELRLSDCEQARAALAASAPEGGSHE